MTRFLGLTWDHPRGREALQAAPFADLSWDVHSLEGFESSPIDELAERYDLIVLDHPHLGDALAVDCLRPLDELFSPAELAGFAADAVGPSFASYTVDGHTWALPLDAATQVSARRPDLLADAPVSWTDALALDVPIAPSLAGPHAFLSLCSIAVSLGGDLGDEFFERSVAVEALEILAEFASRAPAATHGLNPIGLLELMSSTDELTYVPLVYGYVTYSPRVAFGAPPAGERLGSTIGGTGIAVTRRSEPSPELLDHLRWLLSAESQSGFIPQHSGQPSARSAWTDAAVDKAAGSFYSQTLETIEQSWVRPRFPGYIPFQSTASQIIRDGITDPATIDLLASTYREARS
ncbi:carbohydrate ABC transporter substrate-binding protein [Glaciihabitans arcticus]|uniref:Carbohydrate ABC transporter substrate-binding protein n=1 Tax=Glaciihabitans arcticus TaxID=2668039 RepID=A0A4Q9GZ87_9MICO|nr:carbohydrate ABC transporter substrate-binding protein [Glaciihabitans arcticus]TBN57690.1 carbohydrate ABC transporter substrate-binding protein [Glaciihabitans arcticus]